MREKGSEIDLSAAVPTLLSLGMFQGVAGQIVMKLRMWATSCSTAGGQCRP